MSGRRTSPVAGTLLLALVAGCAAASTTRGSAPAAAPEGASRDDLRPPEPQAAPATPAPPPPPPPPASKEDTKKDAEKTSTSKAGVPGERPGEGSGPRPGLETSRIQAESSGELERAQRELELAGANCTNACRALGSMDRAAGKLCGLARSSDEQDRCSDAATKVKTARDRVKRTCGSCPDVTVEHDAAIPSR